MILPQGIFFEQDWVSLRKAAAAASDDIRCGQMRQLLDYLCVDSELQFGGSTIGHPDDVKVDATASRVALESVVLAGNEAPIHVEEGAQILQDAAIFCGPLQTALDSLKDITFNYTSTVTTDAVESSTSNV